MVLKATFNNISVHIMVETGVPGENNIMLYRVHLGMNWIQTHNLVVGH